MRLLFLFLLFFTSLYSFENETKEEYLGSSYNLQIATEPSCLSLVGTSQIINRHIGFVNKFSFCDSYLNNSQDYLQEVYSIGSGFSIYANDIYRDSLFISLILGIEQIFLTDIFTDSTGDALNIDALAGIGYQWHFKRGYILSLGAYALYTTPIKYDNKSDIGLKNELSTSSTKISPTILMGWRF